MTALLVLLLAAEPHRLDSRREAGVDSCPEEAQLGRAVAERLGFDPFSRDAERTVMVRWRAAPGGFSSEVTVLDEQGHKLGARKLSSTAADCAELARSTALALALIIDPQVLTRPAPVAPTAPPSPPPVEVAPPAPVVESPVPLQVPPPAVVVVPPPAERSSAAWWLGAGVGLSVLEVPSATAALELDAAWRWRWLWLGVRAGFVLPGTTAYSVGSVSGVAVGAGPFGCAGGEHFGGCLFTRFGAAHAWASGFNGPNTPGTTGSVAIGLQPYADYQFFPGLRGRLQASVQLQPAVSVLTIGQAEAWRTPVIAFGLGVSAWYEMVGGADASP